RINIEASAALATWNDLYREDPGGRLYTQLVDRAVYYLPMAEEDVEAEGHRVRSPRRPGGSGAGGPGNRRHSTRSGTRRRRASLEPRPCQRPREHGLAQRARGSIHAGGYRGYPLDVRRVTPAEERELMGFVSERLALGMTV